MACANPLPHHYPLRWHPWDAASISLSLSLCRSALSSPLPVLLAFVLRLGSEIADYSGTPSETWMSYLRPCLSYCLNSQSHTKPKDGWVTSNQRPKGGDLHRTGRDWAWRVAVSWWKRHFVRLLQPQYRFVAAVICDFYAYRYCGWFRFRPWPILSLQLMREIERSWSRLMC